MDEKPRHYIVDGRVTGRDGWPERDARVVLWRQHIRSRIELAATSSDNEGWYRLEYEEPPPSPTPALLVLEARSERAEAPVFSDTFAAAPRQRVDLAFEAADLSHWGVFVRLAEPVMGELGLGRIVETAEHHDLTFVSNETGRSVETVMTFALAARLEKAFEIPAAIFYGFLAQHIPSALPSPLLEASDNFKLIDALVQTVGGLICALSAQTQTAAITGAIALDLIPTRYTGEIDRWVEALQAKGAHTLLNSPYLAGTATLGQVLDIAAIPTARQQTFARALATNTLTMRNFWRNLTSGAGPVSAEEGSSIERIVSLGALVKNFAPLVQTLYAGFTDKTYASTADLARLSLADWSAIVERTGAPPGVDPTADQTAAQVFAAVVYQRVTQAYPTAAIAARLANAKIVPVEQQRPLTQFFSNNPSLELAKDNLTVFLETAGETAFANIDADQKSAIVQTARSIQRVLRVAPSVDVAQTLLETGFHSAVKIAGLGRQQFFGAATAAGLTARDANLVYDAASQRYANVVSLYTQLNRDSLGLFPRAMGDLGQLAAPVAAVVQRDQSLATLLGAQDYCTIDDCTSVLSPAAYLCDLLLWLRNHQQGSHTALDVLDDRRPDIRQLLLNCPNSDTELPYIDLVNELLADTVAPVVGSGTALNPQWKQTSDAATRDQLAAAPEYFNQDAYVTLFGAPYPWTLPYSTGLDGLRTYLLQWNLPLWQLREALLPLAGGTVEQQASVAAERLGLNVVAESLVTVADFVSSTVAWNTDAFTTIAAADNVAVSDILQASSLTYEQLVELLEVTWVQGSAAISLIGLNDTCDTTAMGLAPAGPLDAGFLDRAHRFLRLWLATGYKMWELDLLLQTPAVGAGDLNAQTLVNLQAFWRLQKATNLSVDQLLAFYQDIDTGAYLDPDGTTTTSLYASLFLNPTLTWIAPDADLAALATGGAVTDPVLADHLKSIQPALGVTGADATLLFGLTSGTLTLDNLSTIFRANALATALTSLAGLSANSPVANFIALASLLTPTLSPPAAVAALFASPAATLEFIAQASAITASRIGLDALTYLLTPPSATPSANTTLSAGITAAQTSLSVTGAAGFPTTAGFYITIGAEILQVTAIGGAGGTDWTVIRAQQGTIAASASPGAAVGLTGSGGWSTTTQMTAGAISTALAGVQQAVVQITGAATTLASPVTAAQTTITVTAGGGFPSSNFSVYIGSEILLVTAVGGTGNTTWTVQRAQQGTTAAAAAKGAAVTPTSGDLDGAVVAAVAAKAVPTGGAPLAADVTATILSTLQVPGSGQSLLSVLEAPALVAATATLTVGGAPAVGDVLTVTITGVSGPPVTVSYTLTATDAGDVNVTAADLAQAIAASPAATGPQAFLASATSAGAEIILTATVPAPAAGCHCATTAAPSGAAHATFAPANAAFGGTPAATQANFSQAFIALQLFDKAAVLVRALKLVQTDLSWLMANAAVYGGLDFTQLPVTAGQPALPLAPLLSTLLTIQLSRSFTAAPPAAALQTLYQLITSISSGSVTTESQAQLALSTISGWPLTDIEAFAPALGLSFPASYVSPAAYDGLRTLEAMAAAVNAADANAAATTTLVAPITSTAQASITVASAVGFPSPTFYIDIGSEILLVTAFSGADNTTWTVSRGQMGTTAQIAPAGTTVTPTYGAQLVAWGAAPSDEVTAEQMAASALGVLKAQQASEAAWLALAPSLMNPIRENRSAALQAWLIGQRDASGQLIWADTDGLFNYFLIDVQMSSCQVTSRLVQAYIAVQIFVERCRMNLETTLWNSTQPGVIVNPSTDDTWNAWEWMSRYRIWEANREVFLFPENWLIESQRPNRTEIYQTFEQEVRQGPTTADYLQTVVLNYVDRLDGIAHLLVTGTCQDSATGDIYVVARTHSDPPIFYMRTCSSGAWSGWTQIPLQIKAHQVTPAVYRGRPCLFWLDVKLSNEPNQALPAMQSSSNTPQATDRYVTLGVNFSIFRNGSWAPPQAARGKLFDKPVITASEVSDASTIEALYTVKIQNIAAAPASGGGAEIWVEVFRLGAYEVNRRLAGAIESEIGEIISNVSSVANAAVIGLLSRKAQQLGRAVFDGRFSDLELNSNIDIVVAGQQHSLFTWAHETYGPDAEPLIPLTAPDPDLTGEPNLVPEAGALAAYPSSNASQSQSIALTFTSAGALEQNVGPLLESVRLPVRVVGPATDLQFQPTSYFFFQDARRCYYVESPKLYWSGSAWLPTAPSDPATAPYEVVYRFHPFYHPFTRLFWDELASGGFDLLYDPAVQQVPDTRDAPGYSDVFSFAQTYRPQPRVTWDLAGASTSLAAAIDATQTSLTVNEGIWVPAPEFFVTVGSEIMQVTAASGSEYRNWTVKRAQKGTPHQAAGAGVAVTPIGASQDRQFLDFSATGPMSVYHWELFYHIPLYIAQLLSQNQQFEDALTWFQYIFNPTRQGPEPTPQRFWITKPLHDLTPAQIVAEQINTLLEKVNQADPSSVAQVTAWRADPLNPFLLADLRQVAYMKNAIMSYLDNLIAWADNLFASQSREALSEATLIYVIASEILGPTPQAVTPPPHADKSYNDLEPSLDAFANALVDIENVIGPLANMPSPAGGYGLPQPQTLYFKIPPNPQLLAYWGTVADRLYKLRHCQSLSGAPLQLALFDAPIDPGLLIAAQAAGVDLSSVLANIGASVPNYRFTALYPQAMDFVNAVRAYGSALQGALEKIDAGALALLQQGLQRQLLADGADILNWQVQQAQDNLAALQAALALAQQRYNFNNGQAFANAAEITGTTLNAAGAVLKVISAVTSMVGAVAAAVPNFTAGAAGIGGSPVATINDGGGQVAQAAHMTGLNLTTLGDILAIGGSLSNTIGSWQHRADNWGEAAAEAKIQITQTQAQIDAANMALQIAQQNIVLHQEQINNIDTQVAFLTSKFTSDDLYDRMVSSLSATYFQAYQLAFQMCSQVERCYQFELGIPNSNFIQFGYWDSLHKGLLAGESLNHDLRRLQASYLQQNSRRYELSRYVSLAQTQPTVLQTLLETGSCTIDLPESLFDGDYPGHFNRRLTRMSVTVVYPGAGKFDNVKATLTLMTNKVRVNTDTSAGYAENPLGQDPRFAYSYAANAQRIALGNAQDDPGLFINAIGSNISDQRYLPFENAGAISTWLLEMPQPNNEIDLTTVSDVVLHLYYTALDGGGGFQAAAAAANPAPAAGVKLFSALNDFGAGSPTAANPYPISPWATFLTTGATQKLTLSISPSKFPPWTRGKTITVTSIEVLAVAWADTPFNLVPQAPLPTAQLAMTRVAASSVPNFFKATVAPGGTLPATWTFEIQLAGAPDFKSLTTNQIGDVLLLVSYEAS
jgi:hypothetical protein